MYRLPRATWKRKPLTQIVPNKKAVQKKYACRRSRRQAYKRLK